MIISHLSHIRTGHLHMLDVQKLLRLYLMHTKTPSKKKATNSLTKALSLLLCLFFTSVIWLMSFCWLKLSSFWCLFKYLNQGSCTFSLHSLTSCNANFFFLLWRACSCAYNCFQNRNLQSPLHVGMGWVTEIFSFPLFFF